MNHSRCGLTICGIGSLLLGIGGYNKFSLRDVEQYTIPFDKWSPLPRLKSSRVYAGACVLPSLRVFVFCGDNG